MRRRSLLALAAAVLAVPLAHAQPARKPVRIGVLSSTSPEARSKFWNAFKDGMTKRGWVEGRDVSYVYRYTRGDPTRFEPLAAELVAEKPDLLYGGTVTAARALKKATRDIPIVFAYVADPVGSGLVASLARPGGNVTGLTSAGVEMRVKMLELLREIRPELRVVALLAGRGAQVVAEIERAARPMGIRVEHLEAGNEEELDKALRLLSAKRFDGVLFLTAGVLARQRIAERMAEARLPAVYAVSEIVVSGGLLSYGADLEANYRHAATFADRILRGAKPADLPVEQPTTFELVVNLKAAQALGLKIPQSILLRATRVIE
jgi:putative ABC transport system substrate-binding protein